MLLSIALTVITTTAPDRMHNSLAKVTNSLLTLLIESANKKLHFSLDPPDHLVLFFEQPAARLHNVIHDQRNEIDDDYGTQKNCNDDVNEQRCV